MDEAAKNELWKDYENTKAVIAREKLILEYTGLVKIIAGRLSIYLGYHVEYDDLVSYGIFGLIDAIDKFDLNKGIKFETYASLRIRGAILDQIRKMDWIPRTLRQKCRKIESAQQKIMERSGKVVNDEELAKELNISLEELEVWQNQTKILNLISLDEYLDQGSEVAAERGERSKNSFLEQPEHTIEKNELKKILLQTMESLTEKEKKVIIFYYYEELTLKEISILLKVSESRVSQLHTKALQKMKTKLKGKVDLFSLFC